MLLQASGITKLYGITPILDGINLQIEERERIGLVGVNGAGKSTLLKILAGEMSYDSGQVFRSKELTLGYLAQNSGLHHGSTIGEEMRSVYADLIDTEKELRTMEQQIADPERMTDEKAYADLLERYAQRSDWFRERGGYEMETRIRSILHGMGFAEFSQDTPVSTLSGGQKTRLALARILLQAPDLLMLDEPTNHLDLDTLAWLEDYLRAYSGALLVVSHDRYFLDRLVTGIVEIERHRSKRYTGNYSRYIDIKAAEYETAVKQFDKQQDEIAKMEEFIQKNIVRASTTKRAQSRRRALEKMDRMDRPAGDLKKANFSFTASVVSGKDVLRVHNLTLSYEDKQRLFDPISFELWRGDMVALIGPNGTGKTTLLKSLIGDHPPDAGKIEWGAKTKIGYYDQEQGHLNPNNTVLEEVWGSFPHLEEVRIRTVLGNFLFSGEDVLKKVSALSGGEKARVSLTKLMLLEANVLILDEPTNHLDLMSKEVLESALMDYEGTLLFISHDRYFLNKMAERILELRPDGLTTYLGNFDDYTAKKQELKELAEEAAAAVQAKNAAATTASGISAPANSYEEGKQAKREERNRKRRLEQLEVDIAGWEERISELEEQLTLPEVYQDYEAVQSRQEEIARHQQALEDAYEEWELLAAE
ncbi:ribosomal protection-like ABC-F family protein [Paenibacillus bovis]|uniref:Multidrug ABC transporter ATP-binding protein n=1 Tax=Paenibacillus bovis TaxID=1616788 RepID=A0A172ZF50_9BACL|nr:ABC-F family ATP-binding cassette domain-containing protein [Paenibacillus bovis]ANF96002.1 multidrug ABC transporter ATP-binding protein [Paenibacillus bovis]